MIFTPLERKNASNVEYEKLWGIEKCTLKVIYDFPTDFWYEEEILFIIFNCFYAKSSDRKPLKAFLFSKVKIFALSFLLFELQSKTTTFYSKRFYEKHFLGKVKIFALSFLLFELQWKTTTFYRKRFYEKHFLEKAIFLPLSKYHKLFWVSIQFWNEMRGKWDIFF